MTNTNQQQETLTEIDAMLAEFPEVKRVSTTVDEYGDALVLCTSGDDELLARIVNCEGSNMISELTLAQAIEHRDALTAWIESKQ